MPGVQEEQVKTFLIVLRKKGGVVKSDCIATIKVLTSHSDDESLKSIDTENSSWAEVSLCAWASSKCSAPIREAAAVKEANVIFEH